MLTSLKGEKKEYFYLLTDFYHYCVKWSALDGNLSMYLVLSMLFYAFYVLYSFFHPRLSIYNIFLSALRISFRISFKHLFLERSLFLSIKVFISTSFSQDIQPFNPVHVQARYGFLCCVQLSLRFHAQCHKILGSNSFLCIP